MSKQTAVEYLFEKLCGENGYVDTYYMDVVNKIQAIYEEAKAMERKQIKESYKAGFNLRDSFNWECDAPWESKEDLKHNEEEFERYYNETYKGGEQ